MRRLGDGRRQRQQDRWRWRAPRRSREVEHIGVGRRHQRAWFQQVKLVLWRSSWRYSMHTSRRPISMAFKTRCCCWPSSMRWVWIQVQLVIWPSICISRSRRSRERLRARVKQPKSSCSKRFHPKVWSRRSIRTWFNICELSWPNRAHETKSTNQITALQATCLQEGSPATKATWAQVRHLEAPLTWAPKPCQSMLYSR